MDEMNYYDRLRTWTVSDWTSLMKKYGCNYLKGVVTNCGIDISLVSLL